MVRLARSCGTPGNTPRRISNISPLGRTTLAHSEFRRRSFNLIPKMFTTWPTRNTVSGDTRGAWAASTLSSNETKIISGETRQIRMGPTQRFFARNNATGRNGFVASLGMEWELGKSGVYEQGRKNRRLTASDAIDRPVK